MESVNRIGDSIPPRWRISEMIVNIKSAKLRDQLMINVITINFSGEGGKSLH